MDEINDAIFGVFSPDVKLDFKVIAWLVFVVQLCGADRAVHSLR